MRLWSGGGPELTAKKEFLRHPWCKKSDFIQAQGQDRWAERAARGVVQSDWLYTMELGEVKAKDLPEGL